MGSVREIYERPIYERTFTSEPFIVNHAMTALSNELSIENHAISNQLSAVSLRRSRRVGKRDREPSILPVRILKCLRNKSRKLKEFVFKRICASIPKSSKLYCYVKVRKRLKQKCSTKITSLNKITQHEKKLLFNCSSRVYQGLMKVKFRANRYLSLFTCNSLMCRYKNQTHISTFCQFKLSTDIEKNPGPTPDPILTQAKQHQPLIAKVIS